MILRGYDPFSVVPASVWLDPNRDATLADNHPLQGPHGPSDAGLRRPQPEEPRIGGRKGQQDSRPRHHKDLQRQRLRAFRLTDAYLPVFQLEALISSLWCGPYTPEHNSLDVPVEVSESCRRK